MVICIKENEMEQVAALFVAAVLVEAVVNILESIKEKYMDWKFWLSTLGGVGVGVIVAVNYGVDAFVILGFEGQIPVVGGILTGIIIGRGSNYVADILSRLQGA